MHCTTAIHDDEEGKEDMTNSYHDEEKLKAPNIKVRSRKKSESQWSVCKGLRGRNRKTKSQYDDKQNTSTAGNLNQK